MSGKGCDTMKKSGSMILYMVLLIVLLALVKTGTGSEARSYAAVSEDTQISAYSYQRTPVFTVVSPMEITMGMQEQEGNVRIANPLSQRDEEFIFDGFLAALLLLSIEFLLGRIYHVFLWMRSVCLTFLCVLMNQVYIIHRSDGKKRAVFI